MDLSSSKYREEYLKNGPKALRDLNKLHEKVSKNTPTPTIPRVKPTSSHGHGDALHISFLDKTTGNDAMIRESSDYDDAWMEDLPSITSLLKEDIIPATYVDQKLARAPAAHNLDWDFLDLEPEFDEADSFHAPTYTTFSNNPTPTNHGIGKDGGLRNPVDHAKVMSEPLNTPHVLGCIPVREKEGRIFLSTNSPEKLSYTPLRPGKHHVDDMPNANDSSQLYIASSKKRRVSAANGALVPEASTNKESENLEPQANKPVLAPWEDMEGIDMDLLAEFAGIVNFV